MKRILALQGGGLRGVIEVAYLERLEALVRARRGPEVVLGDVFDLVGGTSTGAIIATAVACGLSMAELKAFYFERAPVIFRRRPVNVFGVIPSYDGAVLEREFRAVVGDRRLGDPDLKAHLAMVLKRVDTGAVWIVSSLPGAPYFADPPDGSYIGNRHYALARLLRASAAAPGFFGPVAMAVHDDLPPGVFVDGGVSPYNDPSLALLMLARMRTFGLEWELGADKLALVGVGTGHARRTVPPHMAERSLPIKLAGLTLLGMLQDAERQALTLLQWLGRPLRPEAVNSEIGDMAGEQLLAEPLFTYLRLNLDLDRAGVAALGFELTEAELERLRAIDDLGSLPLLYALGERAAGQQLDDKVLDQLGL